jgi:putative membrane protein insertion efficiency factor
MKLPLLMLLRAYQLLLSPFLSMTGGRCRFHPNCSAYAIEAIRVHGIKKGVRLSLRRLSRCHPWGGGGFDPVPPANEAG